MTRRIAAVLSAACIAILGSGTASWAGQGHSKPAVCHPTGKGWVVIKPAQASSHIDEATGAPKHAHSGRVDQYAVNGACPTIPNSTPTGGTPSATTTAASPTATSVPTESPAPSSSTTSVPSPSTTSPASTTRPSAGTTRPVTSQTRAVARLSTTTSPQPAEPTPASTSPSPASLAATGSSLGGVIVAAAFLLTVGLLVLAFYRVLGCREGGHR